MAISNQEMEDLNRTISTCLEFGIGCGFLGNYERSKVADILISNGWKPTAMQKSNKSCAKDVIIALKEMGMMYQIFYNSEAPKQLAFLGTDGEKNSDGEEYMCIRVLFNFY